MQPPRRRSAIPLVELPAGSARERRAFTLVELLVVVAIIVALLAILMPSMGQAVRASQMAVCTSNTHQLSIALIDYASDHLGFTPNPGTYHTYDQMQYTHYFSHTSTSVGFSNWGLLSKGQYLSHQSGAWFCPLQTNPLYTNPRGPDSSHPNGAPGSKNTSLLAGDAHLGWTFSRSGYMRRCFPNFTGRDATKPIPLSFMADQVILADLFSNKPDVYDTGHGDGVIAAVGDGSSRRVVFDRDHNSVKYWEGMISDVNAANNSQIKTLWMYFETPQ